MSNSETGLGNLVLVLVLVRGRSEAAWQAGAKRFENRVLIGELGGWEVIPVINCSSDDLQCRYRDDDCVPRCPVGVSLR
jgi:hypothetical protein